MTNAGSPAPRAAPLSPRRILRARGWIVLVLLAAAALRLFALSPAPVGMSAVPTGIPPGMTHDEADHGLTAWEIVNGARDIYFTVGYGREPLYDYATALVMAGIGPTIFAARLTSVYFSLLMIAAVYAWARPAFGLPVALLSAAGLAVGFWPVMAGRQALRSIALPALFALAVVFYGKGLTADHKRRTAVTLYAVAGLLLGLTFYTYIPARVMWPAFPALTIYLLLRAGWATQSDEGSSLGRDGFETGGLQTRLYRRRLLAGMGVTLIIAALVAAPLFFFLAGNPGLEARIDELSAPLRAAAGGDLTRLWANARGALRLFTVEGDQTWRYNLPGKPWLGPVMGVLFYAGLTVAGWLAFSRNRALQRKLGFYPPTSAPGAFLALVWLGLGFAPVLVTGPGLSATQAIGLLPVLYLFPALALVAGYHALANRIARPVAKGESRNSKGRDSKLPPRNPSLVASLSGLVAVALFATMGLLTTRDYFGRWANAPEVRVQYETAMVAALRYLDRQAQGAAAVSTITPGRYHTPAVAALTLHNPAVTPRWFDGRQSLLLPDDPAGTLIIPGFTPIPAALQAYLSSATFLEELPLRPDDLDRPLQVSRLDGPAVIAEGLASMTTTADNRPLATNFDGHLELLGYHLSDTEAHPGDTIELVTAWRLLQPLPEASLFAHLTGQAEPLAVADSLGAPGDLWVAGDVLLQLHTIDIPAATQAGAYPLTVGVYTRSDGRRLMTDEGEDTVTLTTVLVGHE